MSVVVLKVGGASTGGVADAVARLGDRVCVVHGAGPQISLEMERAGIPVEFVDGRRVTTPEGLELVRASFRRVNTALCDAIGVANAILQDGDTRRGPAQTGQPGGGRRRIVRLAAQQHPVGQVRTALGSKRARYGP